MTPKFQVNEWIHLTPIELVPFFPTDEDAKVGMEAFIQRFDLQAAQNLHASFQAVKNRAGEKFAGIQMDWDHESNDLTKRTDASAWIMDTKVEGDGLYGLPRWTTDGQVDVEGGVMRFTSVTIPYGDFEDTGEMISGLPVRRPVRLSSAALTNKPRCRNLRPISNSLRESGPVVKNAEPSAIPAEPKPKIEHMKKIAEALGLSPEASEDDIVAAILGLKGNLTSAQGEVTNRETRIGELTTEVSNRDGQLADMALDLHGITDEAERTNYRPLLVSNRVGVTPILAALKTSREAAAVANLPVHNRDRTLQPGQQQEQQRQDEPELTGLERTKAALKAKTPKGE